MSLLDNQTKVNLGAAYFGSGGGGSGGGDITASTITLTGSNAISATLASAPNDGFEVRNGGAGSNVLVIATIDAASAGQVELGIRTLSTTNLYSRYEMDLTPSSGLASLNYQINGSTIGALNFDGGANVVTLSGLSSAEGGSGNQIVMPNNVSSIIVKPSGRDLVAKKGAGTANFYLPPGGSSNIASFSTATGCLYSLSLPSLTLAVEPAGSPAAGSWLSLDVDTAPNVSYCDTFDLASVSTVGNDFRATRQYCFIATATGHTFSATTNNNISTLVECGTVFLENLGNASVIPAAD